MTGANIVERLPDDDVVIDLELMTVFEDERGWDPLWFEGSFLSVRVGWAFVRRRHVGLRTPSAAVEDGRTALILGVIVIVVGGVGVIGSVGHGQTIEVGVSVIAG
jgi:hypothetical protein